MGTVIPPTSPWMFYAVTDDNSGVLWLSASVSFSGAWGPTAPLTGATVFRDPASVYTKVVIGAINPDGTLPAGTKVVTVPLGTTNFTAQQLASQGLNTIADITGAPQITAIP